MSVFVGLGECKQCHGPLCVSGRQVVCERCGHPHEHELTRQPVNAGPPPAPVCQAQDYPASQGDRINTLERTVKAMLLRIQSLESRKAR